MGIRIPGSKSRAERSQLSAPNDNVSQDVSLAGVNVSNEVDLDSMRSDTKQVDELPFVTSQIESTRASRAWTRILPALLLLAVILVFVFQNLDNTKISFLMFSGKVPAALALIVAAALGGSFVLTIGSIRIIQLRKVIHATPDSRTSQSAL
jgi:uncharacterized integral membrane protein